MKEQMLKIAKDLEQGAITTEQAQTLLLGLFGVSGSLPFNAIINPHYDRHSRIDGGLIIANGEIIGHADPIGEQGVEGVAGCNDR